ncbi:MAG: hypothetical protein ABI679_11730 [Gemmatimonadota bacterium]
MDHDVLNMFGVLLAIGGAGVMTYGGAVMIRAFARRMDRRIGPDEADLDDIRDRLGGLEAMQARIGELEERVDFSERLLARPASER